MNILGVIPARGGSKELPRKNLLKLGGKTLIELAVDSAVASKALTRTIVSTDDEEIAQIARTAGADVPFIRPAKLGSDTASNFSVLRHAAQWLREKEQFMADLVVLLQPTTPFRTGKRIDATIELLLETGADASITVRYPEYPPFWMMTMDAQSKVKSLIPNGNRHMRRQDVPQTYQPAGCVYVLRLETLETLESTLLPVGKTVGFPVSSLWSVNIDSLGHYRLAEALWESQVDRNE
jgi:CMP-N,N'-diacetyllegionaminic acid synthase